MHVALQERGGGRLLLAVSLRWGAGAEGSHHPPPSLILLRPPPLPTAALRGGVRVQKGAIITPLFDPTPAPPLTHRCSQPPPSLHR